MSVSQIKFGAQLASKIEEDALAKFVANAAKCKSTKDIVLRELVYAFNRYCEDGRFPVLQRLEVVAPGYIVNEAGSVEDATPPRPSTAPEPGPKLSLYVQKHPRPKNKVEPIKEERPDAI